jgi:septation ring formation regulator EzrA
MTDRINESLERWRVPISIGTLLVLILFIVGATYNLAGKEQVVNARLSQCESSNERIMQDISDIKAQSSKRDIEYAGLRSDMKYIIQTLEEIKRGIAK